jgi:UDP-3-O-[3-hydroxymyristoyl] glucosamine N-acyltransferase
VIIGGNAIVGEDGFGYSTHNGTHHKIPHIGSVIIEDDVEIGSGCGIERGTLSDTVIGKGSKLGDLIAIGHGTKIGEHCLLVAQVGIAGSSTLGHHCVVGGQAGIIGHIKIGNMVRIAAQAGVISDIPDGKTIIGAPAIDQSKAKRAYALIEYLPKMRQSIKKLEKNLKK